MVPALLKWIGNKQRFAELIVDSFPSTFNNYYEPFLGSGAVLAELQSRTIKNGGSYNFNQALSGDALPFLIDIFEYVKSDPITLCDHYEKCINAYLDDPEGQYLAIRERFNTDHNALDFCVLTRTCYSGIVRFRKKDGYMSTPKGPHKPIPPESFRERVALWSELISDTTFEANDFRETMAKAKEGDLVYCDPPYTHSQSIIYGAQSFSIKDLWTSIDLCKKKGVMVALSINGFRKSKTKDIAPAPPVGLFKHEIIVNCGASMIDRLQQKNNTMEKDAVHDKLLLTW